MIPNVFIIMMKVSFYQYKTLQSLPNFQEYLSSSLSKLLLNGDILP